eukprot:TRINITY_DN50358_c0_g1_i1.p1 TRINITY_DN50358_c0_g1~~TRINITY_DN50358_c0_g1_i1.p1  ORF type:complete len:205 (+),score=42.71 TRINITY_DN50358_c0_g1_i1:74-688(+)
MVELDQSQATDAGPKASGFKPQFGEGREVLADGSSYEGSFRFGKREGAGVFMLNAEGTDRYEGQFKDDCFEGLGERRWADGTVYEGQWLAGRKHGDGTLTEPSGRVYQGQWKDGKRHGFGIQRLDSESRYEGRWDNGMQHGTGKYFDLRKETVYEGTWQCGAHHGKGVLRSKGGHKEKLTYVHGMLTSREDVPPPKEYLPVWKA